MRSRNYSLILCGLIILINIISTSDTKEEEEEEECGRHRKPWHQLSRTEQMLYVDGFKELRRNGILDVFIETHHLADTPLAFADVHYTAQFFPWHSYFLTEIESQIRNLGEKYKCFSLPYWDFTTDSGYSQADDMPIYNTVIGSDGNEDNDFCVEDDLWNRDEYKTTFLCSSSETKLNINCCLKRHHGLRGHVPSLYQLSPHIYNYHRWRDFQDAVVHEHTFVHGYVGVSNMTHMFGHNAAEDPLFIMLHNFLMYIRSLRTTCFGYDRIINELENYQPFAYDPYQNDPATDMKPFIDLAMDFNILTDQEWSQVHKEDITIRKIFDPTYFNISYELGTFWYFSDDLQKYCQDNLNKTWFYNDGSYDYQKIPQTLIDRNLYLKHLYWQNINTNRFVYVVTVIVVLAMIAIIHRYKSICCRKSNKLTLLNNGNVYYGSVQP